MQLVLDNKTPWKWTNSQNTNVCQISNWNWNFRKFEETTHTQKYEKTHWHWLWKGFLYLRTGTKIENVWFCSGGFSCAIQEKFTAWQVNSTLNFTRKTDIARIVVWDRCPRSFPTSPQWGNLPRMKSRAKRTDDAIQTSWRQRKQTHVNQLPWEFHCVWRIFHRSQHIHTINLNYF